MSSQTQEITRAQVFSVLVESLHQICGGGLYLERAEDEKFSPRARDTDDDSWIAELTTIAQKSISFPNKTSRSLDGKPHDVEIRCALGLFHKCGGKKRKRADNATPRVTAVSDLGLKRSIGSPLELATLLCSPLEESLRNQNVSHDVRSNASGIICIVTLERAQALRDSGRLPCSKCVKWCKGEKGLWWHQQMEHGSEHSVAAAAAASEQTVLAVVPYNAEQQQTWLVSPTRRRGELPTINDSREKSVFEFAKQGKLEAVKHAIENDGFDPKETLDRNGASLLLWAAGCGHLDIVKYLIEVCCCSPSIVQRGKRSFAGRTPLHWAARNGHFDIVQYLVDTCHVDIDATTSDSTTAFCWASWQAHLPVMKFLHEKGADIRKENSFGCNAVLWCAQGKGTVETMKWLESIGLNLLSTNTNGHTVLHKAAQRKRKDLCEWLCTSVFESADGNDTRRSLLDLIGPDTEGFCPSDLAGAAGDDELALFVAKQETRLAHLWVAQDRRVRGKLPEWLQQQNSLSTLIMDEDKLNVWEPQGGVRRIQLSLTRQR